MAQFAGLPDGYAVQGAQSYAGLPDGYTVNASPPKPPHVQQFGEADDPNDPGANVLARQMKLGARDLVQGALSLPATLADIPAYAYNKGADFLQGDGKGFRFPEQNQAVANALTQGGLPQPENATERVVGGAAQAVAGVGGSYGLGSALQSATAPAARTIANALTSSPGMQATSAASGATAGGIARESGASTPVQIAATLAGGMVPSAAVAAGRGIANWAAPDPVNAETRRLVDRADNLGIDIRPGQARQPGFLNTADEALSRSPLTGFSDTPGGTYASSALQRRQFNEAVSRTFGSQADFITPHVLAQAEKRIGDVYETVLPRNTVSIDNDLATGLGDIKTAADQVDVALPANDRGRIQGTVDYLISTIQKSGSIPGKVYQEFRKRGGLLDALASDNNGTISGMGSKMRDALDAAFERQAQPLDAALLKEANQQYRNLSIVKPLAAKAPDGNISPALLQGAVIKEYPNYATQGAGDIGDLAKIGQRFLKAPANSMTAERSLTYKIMNEPLQAAKMLLAAPFAATMGHGMNAGINSPFNRNALMGLRTPTQPMQAFGPAAPATLAALLAQSDKTSPQPDRQALISALLAQQPIGASQ